MDYEKEEFVSSLFRKEENRYTLISTKFTVISIIKAFFLEPFADTYPSIRAPLLLIHATYPKFLDKARLLGIHQIETAIKDVTIIAMEHSGHMLQWDEPEQTAIVIKKWILEKEYITKYKLYCRIHRLKHLIRFRKRKPDFCLQI